MEAVLKSELDLYEKMFAFSQEQVDLLAQNDPDVDRITDLMNQKMEILNGLRQLEEDHSEIKATWEKNYQTYTVEQRSGVALLKDRMLSVIEEMQKMEEVIAKGMRRIEKEVSRKLHNLNKGRAVNRAYFKHETGPPRYIDKKK